MERKRIEKLVALLLIGILIPVSLFPFRISADSITSSNINGISVVLDEVTFIENKTWTISGGTLTLPRNYFNYKAEIQFDKSYLGYVDITISYTYFARNDTGVTNFNGTKVQKVFVNGDKAYLAFGFIANSSTDPLTYSSISYTLNSSDLIEYGLLSDIETIIDILQENQDIISDIDLELETVISNTSLSNQYLEKLTLLKNWNVPIESWPIVFNRLASTTLNLIDSFRINNNIQMPCFEVPANGLLAYRMYMTKGLEYKFVFYLASAGATSDLTFSNTHITVLSKVTYDEVDTSGFASNYKYFRRYEFRLTSSISGYTDINSTVTKSLYIPIYFGASENKRISTDFALLFGLSNQLLDDIHMIAQGTSQSSSASGSLDQTTSQFSDDANDLVTIEESFNDSMNQSLQSVNPTFNMGSSFLTSANWVSQQFNRIVNDTPFASLITFGLTLGLGLLIIGKVRK